MKIIRFRILRDALRRPRPGAGPLRRVAVCFAPLLALLCLPFAARAQNVGLTNVAYTLQTANNVTTIRFSVTLRNSGAATYTPAPQGDEKILFDFNAETVGNLPITRSTFNPLAPGQSRSLNTGPFPVNDPNSLLQRKITRYAVRLALRPRPSSFQRPLVAGNGLKPACGFDFDGDGVADMALFTPSDGVWRIVQSSEGPVEFPFGQSGDKPIAADYDGDGKMDIAVFRPSDGTWYVQGSSAGFFTRIFGAAGDTPVPGDYDGDGKTDISVYRPSNGYWYVQGSKRGFFCQQFGLPEDIPVPGDFDGDERTDFAVFRPSSGCWFVYGSKTGFFSGQFGARGDLPLHGDFDGDGLADFAVFRPEEGMWYVQGSRDGFTGLRYGESDDLPIPGDYDGDGVTDFATFNRQENLWRVFGPSGGFFVLPFDTNDAPLYDAVPVTGAF